MVRLLVLFLTICFYSSAQTQEKIDVEIISPDSNLVFQTESIKGVILGNNFKYRIRLDSLRVHEIDPLTVLMKKGKGRRFEPTLRQVLSIEPELKVFLKEEDQFISDSLSCYVKQYLGYIDGKDSVVYINAFYDKQIDDRGDWKKSWIAVLDGWNKYFKIKYNLRTNEFFDFRINAWR